MRRRVRVTTEITKKQFYVLVGALVTLLGVFFAGVTTESKAFAKQEILQPITIKEEPINVIVKAPEVAEAPEVEELYEEGFKYYMIPEEYAKEGGYLPEEVQEYIWKLCEERSLDYYIVLALIERESGYKSDSVGDSGNSYGYTQINKRWHLERMEEEEVQDLTDPYGNLRVCTNFLQELYERYGSSGDNCVLMAYNMGASKAKELWREGVYSSKYSRGILQRAQEIEQELKD